MKRITALFITMVFVGISAFGQMTLSDSQKSAMVAMIGESVHQKVSFPITLSDVVSIKDIKAEGTSLVIMYQMLTPEAEAKVTPDRLLNDLKSSAGLNLDDKARQLFKTLDLTMKFEVYDHNGTLMQTLEVSGDDIADMDPVSVEEYLNNLIKSEFSTLPQHVDGATITDVSAKDSTLYMDVVMDEGTIDNGNDEDLKEFMRMGIVSSFGTTVSNLLGKKGIGIVYRMKDQTGNVITIDIKPEDLLKYADTEEIDVEDTSVENMAKIIKMQGHLPKTDENSGLTMDVSAEDGYLVFTLTSISLITDLALSSNTTENVKQSMMEDSDVKELVNSYPVIYRFISTKGKIMHEVKITKESYK